MKKFLAKAVALSVLDFAFVPSSGRYAITISNADLAKLIAIHPSMARLASKSGEHGVLMVGEEWLHNLATSNKVAPNTMFNLLRSTDCSVIIDVEERLKGAPVLNDNGTAVLDINGQQKVYGGLQGYPEDKPYATYINVIGDLGDKARLALFQTATNVETQLQLEAMRKVEAFVPRSRRGNVVNASAPVGASTTTSADPVKFRDQLPSESDAEYAEAKAGAGFVVETEQ